MNVRNQDKGDIILRVLADSIMVQISIISAFALRLFALVLWGSEGPFDNMGFFSGALRDSLDIFMRSGWLLTGIAIISFYLNGFYTRTRAYRGRYKSLVVLRAITLAFLSFGFLSYFLPFILPLPRSVFIASYLISILFIGGARLWMFAWRRIPFQIGKINVDENTLDRRILVIGGAGYIGSTFCRLLLDRGYVVRALDLLLYGGESIEELNGNRDFELVVGDSRNIEALVRCLDDVDTVVHLGEIVGDLACAYDEDLTTEVNHAATKMVAEAAKGKGISRFIYASSCSVYGSGNEILDEQAHLSPLSHYASAKIAAENALMSLNGQSFAPTILRFATVYGLSHRMRFDLVVNLLTAKAVCDGEIPIFGGNQWRPFIHVQDAARALLLCLESPLEIVGGNIFNAGFDAQNSQIIEIGRLIERIIPEGSLCIHEEKDDPRNYHVSFKKIHQQLGFNPSMMLDDGVLEIATALRAGKIDDYRNPKYSNYRSFTENGALDALRQTTINSMYFTPTAGTSLSE